MMPHIITTSPHAPMFSKVSFTRCFFSTFEIATNIKSNTKNKNSINATCSCANGNSVFIISTPPVMMTSAQNTKTKICCRSSIAASMARFFPANWNPSVLGPLRRTFAHFHFAELIIRQAQEIIK